MWEKKNGYRTDKGGEANLRPRRVRHGGIETNVKEKEEAGSWDRGLTARRRTFLVWKTD